MSISKNQYYLAIRIINRYEKKLREDKFVTVHETKDYNKALEIEKEYLDKL